MTINKLHRMSVTVAFIIMLVILSTVSSSCNSGASVTQPTITTSNLPLTDLYYDINPATLTTDPTGISLTGNFAVILVFKDTLTAAQREEFLNIPLVIIDSAGNRYEYFQSTILNSVKRIFKRGPSVIYFFNVTTGAAPYGISVNSRPPVKIGDPFTDGGSC